jgi:hypothetical protein
MLHFGHNLAAFHIGTPAFPHLPTSFRLPGDSAHPTFRNFYAFDADLLRTRFDKETFRLDPTS